MTRYHINPSNKVLRCNAQSADSCPFGSNAHFEGDKDQAKFMQDALDRNLKKTPPAPKAPKPADNFSFSSMGDSLYAEQREDGTYAIYTSFNGERVLVEENIAPMENRVSFVRHLGQLARTSGYAGHVVETFYQKYDPEVTQVREVREKGNIIGFLAQKQGGWMALRKLSELKSRPLAQPGDGVIRAAFKLRREAAQQIAYNEVRAQESAAARAKLDAMIDAGAVEEAARARLVAEGKAPSLRTQPRSATTKPPFPYGPGPSL